jgi:hypothetical protein
MNNDSKYKIIIELKFNLVYIVPVESVYKNLNERMMPMNTADSKAFAAFNRWVGEGFPYICFICKN